MSSPSYLGLSNNDEPLVDLLNGTYGELDETAWRLDDDIKLSPESCKVLLEAHKIVREFLSKDGLKAFGLNPNLPGTAELMGHMRRVAILSLAILDEMLKQGQTIAQEIRRDILALGALLHDIGKLNPDIQKIVCSKEKLPKDDPRWNPIKKHPQLGHDFVLTMSEIPSDIRQKVAETILCHHEQMVKENGYYQIHNDLVPLESRIVTIADAVDVMLYRGLHQAVKQLYPTLDELTEKNAHFHPKMAVAAKSAFGVGSGRLIYSITSPDTSAKGAREKLLV